MTPLRPITAVADELGLPSEDVCPWGPARAKVALSALARAPDRRGGRRGKLVLVSAINPTPPGEGKTTVSVGLAMGLRRRGRRPVLALREPSLGPVFGVKGGGTGGGLAQVEPAVDINLHFTGDIHAVTSAHNLLAALVDNALYHGAPVPLEATRVRWRRALDMNDRALRNVVIGLGGRAHGVPRESAFDITAASEVMAILALAEDLVDLEARLGRIVVGRARDGRAITARDLEASSAMTALLKDALLPNLVQTREGGPALVHAGPFGNIAHGCNSVVATKLALAYGDEVITEAGFGFDLGAEKFLDIKCRGAGLWPDALVLVVTLRALKYHGGVPAAAAADPSSDALVRGFDHLAKHLESVATFGLPVVIAVNRFPQDTAPELATLAAFARAWGVPLAPCDGFSRGGEGALELADALSDLLAAPRAPAAADGESAAPEGPRFLYDLADPPEAKMQAIARKIYGADDVVFTAAAKSDLAAALELGAGGLPICMAKTHLSLTDDARRLGRPRGFDITVREVRLSAGAGFLVALTGDVLTMPGLPKEPAARRVSVTADGEIGGLMQGEPARGRGE